MTYKMIASLAGVSVSTVSKVMAGSSEISAETAEKVRQIAAEYGVRRPRYNKENPNRKIAIIVPEIISFQYSRFVTALNTELRKKNMESCVYITDFQDNVFCNIIDWIYQDESICGIINLDEIRTKEIPEIPMVVLQPLNNPEFDTICEDQTTYFSDILKYLLSLGHKKIGYIGEINTKTKDKSFYVASAALELTIDPVHIFISNKRFEEIGIEAAQYFSSMENRPTALVAAYDEIAHGAITEFQKKGIHVPEDISIVGINNVVSSMYVSVPLTTVHTFNEEMMHLAVKLLLHRIEKPKEHITQHVLVNSKLIIRESTGKVKKVKKEN